MEWVMGNLQIREARLRFSCLDPICHVALVEADPLVLLGSGATKEGVGVDHAGTVEDGVSDAGGLVEQALFDVDRVRQHVLRDPAAAERVRIGG